MTENRGLHDLVERAALRWPERPAVEDPATGARITYAELSALSDRVRDRLCHSGVGRGDRVGISLHKSIDDRRQPTAPGRASAGSSFFQEKPGDVIKGMLRIEMIQESVI